MEHSMNSRRVVTTLLPLFALAVATACSDTHADKTASAAQEPTMAQTPVGRLPAPPSVAYDSHVSAGGLAPTAEIMHNPFTDDTGAAATGEKLFTAMNCDGCHGGGATGWVGPSLSAKRWRYGGSDGAVYHSIFYGRPKGMPAFGGILPSDQIWRIVTYLRTLPLPKGVPTESWPSGN